MLFKIKYQKILVANMTKITLRFIENPSELERENYMIENINHLKMQYIAFTLYLHLELISFFVSG